MKRNIGDEIIKGLKEAILFEKGKITLKTTKKKIRKYKTKAK